MKNRLISLLAAALLAIAVPSLADDLELGDLAVAQPWARASAGNIRNGAAYFAVTNTGAEPDRLIAVASPAAAHAALHNHVSEDGVMKMRPVEAVELAPGEQVVLEPGGLHVMLMGLARPLVEGESFPLTLTFEKAGDLEVTVEIAGVAAMQGGHQHSTTH